MSVEMLLKKKKMENKCKYCEIYPKNLTQNTKTKTQKIKTKKSKIEKGLNLTNNYAEYFRMVYTVCIDQVMLVMALQFHQFQQIYRLVFERNYV